MGTEFVEDVDSGDWAGAQGNLSSNARCSGVQDDLAQIQADGLDARMDGFTLSGDVDSTPGGNSLGSDTLDLSGTATVDGVNVPISVEVFNDGGWGVCSFDLDG